LDRVHLGHFLPDYTAYEELLELFRDFVPIPILCKGRRLPSPGQLRDEIVGRGVGALLLSNPSNPTGDVIFVDDLQAWIQLSRELRCSLIVDGLTKNWRYPGLRLSWTLGPAHVMEAIISAGSFLDGGAPHPVQEMAVALLDPSIADLEAQSIQAEFSRKRRFMIDRIRQIGFVLENEPLCGFYSFGPSMPELELGMNRLADLCAQS
jgi:aspartate/methionine/tyrosine aminotransferase